MYWYGRPWDKLIWCAAPLCEIVSDVNTRASIDEIRMVFGQEAAKVEMVRAQDMTAFIRHPESVRVAWQEGPLGQREIKGDVSTWFAFDEFDLMERSISEFSKVYYG